MMAGRRRKQRRLDDGDESGGGRADNGEAPHCQSPAKVLARSFAGFYFELLQPSKNWRRCGNFSSAVADICERLTDSAERRHYFLTDYIFEKQQKRDRWQG